MAKKQTPSARAVSAVEAAARARAVDLSVHGDKGLLVVSAKNQTVESTTIVTGEIVGKLNGDGTVDCMVDCCPQSRVHARVADGRFVVMSGKDREALLAGVVSGTPDGPGTDDEATEATGGIQGGSGTASDATTGPTDPSTDKDKEDVSPSNDEGTPGEAPTPSTA